VSMRSVAGIAALALVVAACSSAGPAAPTATSAGGGSPTTTPGSVATNDTSPTQGGQTGQPFSGSLKDLAHKLAPDGSTQVAEVEVGGAYSLSVTSSLGLDQLTSFWESRIPSLGMTLAASVKTGGGLYLSTTNPNGGIVASPDPSGGGGFSIAISLSSE